MLQRERRIFATLRRDVAALNAVVGRLAASSRGVQSEREGSPDRYDKLFSRIGKFRGLADVAQSSRGVVTYAACRPIGQSPHAVCCRTVCPVHEVAFTKSKD
jgi:hypothetical protein